MIAERLKQTLSENNVNYDSIKHPSAYTCLEVCEVSHIPSRDMAKPVILNADGKFIMAVIPADHKLDLDEFREISGLENVRLASEDEFTGLFPDCETGAMPPFGNLYQLDVWIDEDLTQEEQIGFNAGFHNELVTLAYSDFENLVHPQVAKFAY